MIYNGHGAATISVLAGGSIVSGEFVLAGDSSLLVSGPGSNISGEYFLSVATTFSNHAVADFDYAQFIGELVVDGIGTTVTANETFRIFESGSIRNGGQVVSTGSTLVGGSLIDNSPEPQPGDPYPGNLEIDGVGSQLISGPFGVRVAGTFPQSSLILNNGGSVSGSVFNSGTVSGSGTITGSISNGGIVKPKLLHINDSFNQSDGGRLQFEIGGTTPIEHGRLVVDDMLALNGSLDILLVDGFVPQPGDTFDLLDFGSVFVNGLNLNAALPAPLSWDTTRLFSEGIIKAILPGDYNDNGTVDAADYVVWRKQIVSNPGQMLPNDGTPFVGSDDYTTWRANFGNVAPSGSASSVPEPLGPAMAYTIALCIPLFRFRVVWCV